MNTKQSLIGHYRYDSDRFGLKASLFNFVAMYRHSVFVRE